MKDNKKIVKVYSNNSKKARIKRNKNKFQRIWDEEKQTYVKVRKAKYPARTNGVRKDWRVIDHSKAIERRTTTPKKPKSVPVNAQQMEKKVAAVIKPETRQTANTKRISGTGATITRIGGVNFTWDSKTLHYKRVA